VDDVDEGTDTGDDMGTDDEDMGTDDEGTDTGDDMGTDEDVDNMEIDGDDDIEIIRGANGAIEAIASMGRAIYMVWRRQQGPQGQQLTFRWPGL